MVDVGTNCLETLEVALRLVLHALAAFHEGAPARHVLVHSYAAPSLLLDPCVVLRPADVDLVYQMFSGRGYSGNNVIPTAHCFCKEAASNPAMEVLHRGTGVGVLVSLPQDGATDGWDLELAEFEGFQAAGPLVDLLLCREDREGDTFGQLLSRLVFGYGPWNVGTNIVPAPSDRVVRPERLVRQWDLSWEPLDLILGERHCHPDLDAMIAFTVPFSLPVWFPIGRARWIVVVGLPAVPQAHHLRQIDVPRGGWQDELAKEFLTSWRTWPIALFQFLHGRWPGRLWLRRLGKGPTMRKLVLVKT